MPLTLPVLRDYDVTSVRLENRSKCPSRSRSYRGVFSGCTRPHRPGSRDGVGRVRHRVTMGPTPQNRPFTSSQDFHDVPRTTEDTRGDELPFKREFSSNFSVETPTVGSAHWEPYTPCRDSSRSSNPLLVTEAGSRQFLSQFLRECVPGDVPHLLPAGDNNTTTKN